MGYFGFGNKLNTGTYVLWLLFNVAYIGLILGIIALAVSQKHSKSVNLAIGFFVLFIITRYIGFIMDFAGYTTLSVLFIIGGGLLIVGAIYIRKWHKNLMEKVAKE
jgi:hypothetical protein